MRVGVRANPEKDDGLHHCNYINFDIGVNW
jgi:hypothetical protein